MAHDALRIEPLTHADIPAALRLSTQAGWNQLAADWNRLLDLWPGQCICGRNSTGIVATGTLTRYEPVMPGKAAVGWVGMILVDQACRNRGYGGAIFDGILEVARRTNIGILGLDATEMGQPVYEKRQFATVCAVERWLASSPKEVGRLDDVARRHGLFVQDLTDTDWPEVLQLDLEAVSVNRAMLWKHLAGEEGAIACVVRSSSGEAAPLEAAGILRQGRTAGHIGPIIGRSDAAARACLAWLIEQHSRRDQEAIKPLIMDIEPRRSSTLDLAARGFACSRLLARMILENEVPRQEGVPAADSLQRLYGSLAGAKAYAMAGFELG